jgi:hypothetical protein
MTLTSTHPILRSARRCGRDWADQIARGAEAAAQWTGLTADDCYTIRSVAPRAWERIGGCTAQVEEEARAAYYAHARRRYARGEIGSLGWKLDARSGADPSCCPG